MLLKFFLNSSSQAYLRSLAEEFNESTNSVRLELNKFEEAGLLQSKVEGNKKIYRANSRHPLFPDIHSIVLKYVGIDKVIEQVVEKLGDVQKVFLVGDFAKGINSPVMDLNFIGENINGEYLMRLINKAEKLIERKIKYLVFNFDEYEQYIIQHNGVKPLLLWQKDTEQ
eukprot:Anaeramoba_ignava/c20984_g1_i3.p1 GENE.c20984_g1_i3~~c20984_g1_i3.p1  ORF type:complete len:169 (+),score=9.11 c20984_g1_i3:61-567(+)